MLLDYADTQGFSVYWNENYEEWRSDDFPLDFGVNGYDVAMELNNIGYVSEEEN